MCLYSTDKLAATLAAASRTLPVGLPEGYDATVVDGCLGAELLLRVLRPTLNAEQLNAAGGVVAALRQRRYAHQRAMAAAR